MSITRKLAKKLTKYPIVKRNIKNMYAYAGDFFSDKKTNLPGVRQISSNHSEHNFGYYDKSPWSRDQRYMIYLAPSNAVQNYVLQEETPIVLYDCESGEEHILTKTHVWNSQQGCMLQWLGPDFSTRILFNDFRDGKYCSVIYSVIDGTEKVLEAPVYSVSLDGKTAVTLDFSRLNTFRPGYGYCNLKDITAEEKFPDISCIWRLDLEKNQVEAMPFTYMDLAHFQPKENMAAGFHKVNHIMLNPSATRFMFIHRWIVKGVTYHRLMTCNVDGSDLYVLLDDGMVSHSNWKNDNRILSYCYTEKEGDAYHLLYDKTQKRETIGKGILTVDGHPSYSPDGRFIITDTYPDWKRKQTLYLIRVSDGKVKRLGEIYSNVKYRNEMRCDLHPRWDYNSAELCFDGSPGNKRQVYALRVDTDFED